MCNKMTRNVVRSCWSHIWAGSATHTDKTRKGYGQCDVRFCETHGVDAYITKIQNDYEMDRFGSERFRYVEFSKTAQKALRGGADGVSIHTGC